MIDTINGIAFCNIISEREIFGSVVDKYNFVNILYNVTR